MQSFEAAKGLPFWIWDKELHKKQYSDKLGLCCFNHWIGLPEKNGQKKPLFEYERPVLEALQHDTSNLKDIKSKHLWIKKCRGSGMSELMLRYMAWLCLKDNSYSNSQMAIVTGPRIELAIDLIERMKKLFHDKKEVQFDSDKTTIILNGCRTRAYPSNHLDAMRGQEAMAFILIDEGDFFPIGEQQAVREVAEGYIAKSDPFIILISTPNLPGQLFENIEREPEETCLYKRVFIPYTGCVGAIYSQEEIEKARASPSFEREYNLQYGHGEGNIFPYQMVNLCLQNYDLSLGDGTQIIAVDPAYGSSKYAILIAQESKGLIYIKEAIEYERPDPTAMMENIALRAKECGGCQIVVDSARPEVIDGLTRRGYSVVRCEFNKQLSEMTMKAAQAVKEQKVRIHTCFVDLINQLKAIQYDEKGHPNKKKMSFDLGDCLLMAISGLDRKYDYTIYPITRR
jgi:hypothetical protein